MKRDKLKPKNQNLHLDLRCTGLLLRARESIFLVEAVPIRMLTVGLLQVCCLGGYLWPVIFNSTKEGIYQLPGTVRRIHYWDSAQNECGISVTIPK